MKKTLINTTEQSGINEAIVNELSAEAMYRGLANAAQYIGLFGFQKYFLNEAANEAKHYQRLVDAANDLGFLPTYEVTTPIVSTEPAEMINIAAEAELKLLDFYSEKATTQNAALHQLYLEFVEIQRKSVGEIMDIKARFDLGGDIYMFDNYLGSL